MSRVIFKSFGQSAFVYGSERFRIDELLLPKNAPFVERLNKTYKTGGDELKLATRIHGQCEIHCWIKGENRLWVSNIIGSGLSKQFVFLPEKRWESIVEFLRSNSEDPVVLSSTVTGEWEGLPKDKWDLEGSLSRTCPHLEITPDTWKNYVFN